MPPKSGKKGKGGPQNAPGIKGKATKAIPMDASDSEDDSSDLGSSDEGDQTSRVGISNIFSLEQCFGLQVVTCCFLHAELYNAESCAIYMLE
ncbi:hypothetical protein CHS0354_011365 [Potamilus streckersoni]|uniref:Uncharacterized protein n=1 Tax=Potamilus streckersoni TaxID=2493646 RepID=A0AAE0T6B9_9BIVA|nr:hypothetical protein CHS0354_011365 [Potamilus streckersoni]